MYCQKKESQDSPVEAEKQASDGMSHQQVAQRRGHNLFLSVTAVDISYSPVTLRITLSLRWTPRLFSASQE